MTQEAYDAMLSDIMEILIEKGLKSTTMDSVAASLKMSKRTLYEIFSSKTNMIDEAVAAFNKRMDRESQKVFANSRNLVEGIIRTFKVKRDFISRVNVNYFRDMDFLFPEARKASDESQKDSENWMIGILKRGVKEGYFNSDINFEVQVKMQSIQIESLKRMEEFFPPGLTIIDVYDNINLSFIRGLSTHKGLDAINETIEELDREFHEEYYTMKKNEVDFEIWKRRIYTTKEQKLVYQ